MTDRKTLIYAIELRKSIAIKNNQAFVDFPYEIVGDILTMLKKQKDVVLCKDCKKYNTDECEIDKLEYSPAYDDWFCGDGEHK